MRALLLVAASCLLAGCIRQADAAGVGISTQQARTAAPVAVGNANAEGVSLAFARADHVHGNGAVVNVKAAPYSAVGDGIADDTAALNSAAGVGGAVIIPPGTYSFTALNTIGAVDVELICQPGAVLKSNTTGTAVPIDAWSSAKRVTVRGCKFTHGANTPATFISVKGSKVTLSGLDFSGTSATRAIDNIFAYRTTLEHIAVNGFTGIPIYLEQSAADATFSYSIAIRDLELSNITGTGIVIEGGSVTIDSSTIESCSAGGLLVSSNWTTFPLTITGLHMEANTGYDIKLDSDAGTGTRWAHINIDGGHIVTPAGFVFNGRGYLHLRNVDGISGTLNVTQLNAMTTADTFVWQEGGRNISVATASSIGLIKLDTGGLSAKLFTSTAATGTTSYAMNAGAHLVFNADGDSSAWIDYDNVSSLVFNKRLSVQAAVASTTGFFVADAAVTATIRGAIADGAGAVGVDINNNVALTTAGTEIAKFSNNGVRKAGVDKDGALRQVGVTFANLPASPVNGTFIYCSDCTIANPCAAAGTGALAKRLNSVWICN